MEALPRKDVLAFLSQENAEACQGYLEHIITDLKEEGSDFHDKLAEIYLEKAKVAVKKGSSMRSQC